MSDRLVVIPEATWRGWEERHTAAVDALTGDHAERRRRGESHPVVDFLFTYYSTRVGAVRRWHPGPGLLLERAEQTQRSGWRHYRPASAHGRTGLTVDPVSVRDRDGVRIDRVRRIVSLSRARPGLTGCFGLHEWAMLYRTSDADVRHRTVPLRLSHARIDEVVESADLRCTHVDAFRFFTPDAVPLNARFLTRATQIDDEQPGCLHAGMDLYHFAVQLGPACPGELLVDCLRAAFDAREVDMRSSPYDLSAWGLDPLRVETQEGRAEFAAFQRGWIRRTDVLRVRILDCVDRISSGDRADPGAGSAYSIAVAPSPAATPATT